MKIECPFLIVFDDKVKCPYLKIGSCDDIEINPGNSDAWCTKQIEENLEDGR